MINSLGGVVGTRSERWHCKGYYRVSGKHVLETERAWPVTLDGLLVRHTVARGSRTN